jgi:hypothetical protein
MTSSPIRGSGFTDPNSPNDARRRAISEAITAIEADAVHNARPNAMRCQAGHQPTPQPIIRPRVPGCPPGQRPAPRRSEKPRQPPLAVSALEYAETAAIVGYWPGLGSLISREE